jgi:dienelactone hydrolase
MVLRAEAGEQGKIPFLIIRRKVEHISKRRPVVICMHSTGRSKESMRPFMEAYASLGYVAVGVDARYHGDRGRSQHAYGDGLVAGWKTGEEMPFLFDTVWDLTKIVDYLTGRPDVDPERIGMMGISLGGMHTWFTAVADPRIAAAVPLIGVQSFGWAVANDQWQARVFSIPRVFQVAAEDLGKDEVDNQTVVAVWQRLAPGLLDFLDSPQTVPAIAPRPLLIYNGKEDPRCPIQGLTKVLSRTAERYKDAGVPELFKFIAEEGLAHNVSEEMGDATISWFNKHLRP